MARRLTEPGSDLTVVIRECGERTASVSASLVQHLLPEARVERLHSLSFNESLRDSLRLGLSGGRKWTLCIDADALVHPRLLDLIAEAETLHHDTFAVQGLVTDKLLLSNRPAGNHLYRTRLIHAALPLVPMGDSLRPETETIQAMAVKGFPLHQSRVVIGVHDFEQWLEDLYAKAFLHGHKHRHLMHLFRPAWEILAETDPDFRVALLGLDAALSEARPSIIARRSLSDSVRASIAEKAPLTLDDMDLSSFGMFTDRVDAWRTGLQKAIDEAVFPQQTVSLLTRASRTIHSGSRWMRLVRPSYVRGTERDALPPVRRKLLFAIDSLTGGGAERVIAHLANHFSDAYDVQIALTLGSEILQELPANVRIVDLTGQVPANLYFGSYPGPKLAFTELLEDYIAELVGRTAERPTESRADLPGELRNLRLMTIALGRHLLAWKPDCVLSFLPNTNLLALMARNFYAIPIPVICSDRNYLDLELQRLPWPGPRRFLIRRHYPTADRHIVLSPTSGEHLSRDFHVPSSAIVTIPNGVDIEAVRRLATLKVDDEQLMRGKDELRIVAVGRLTRQKGFDVLIRALGGLDTHHWRLSLIGEGEDEQDLRSLSQELGVSDRIEFLGWRSNPYTLMAQSDVFVLSSRWEGMPNVLLEALALGLAVVATDCPTGPSEILERGRFGQLVPPDSPEALRAAIHPILTDARERQRYAELARTRADAYSFAAMASRYEHLFRQVLAPASTDARP